MLFFTNRVLKQSSLSRVGRPVDFDLRDTSPQASFFCCERQGPEKYVEIGSAGFLQRLFDDQAPGLIQVVAFIWPCRSATCFWSLPIWRCAPAKAPTPRFAASRGGWDTPDRMT